MLIVVEFAYVALGLVFICLCLAFGGLLVATLFVLLDPPAKLAPDADLARVQAGRWRALRRFAIGWAVAAILWVAAGQGFRMATGM